MRTTTDSCGILTFAILLHLSLVLGERETLGESDQKLAIPAVYVEIIVTRRLSEEGASCRWTRGSSPAAICLELRRESA
jgi:hypothetical protein